MRELKDEIDSITLDDDLRRSLNQSYGSLVRQKVHHQVWSPIRDRVWVQACAQVRLRLRRGL